MTFIVKPYLQPGNNPHAANPERLEVMWHTDEADAAWRVQFKPEGKREWAEAASVLWTRVDLPPITLHRVYRARLDALAPGGAFDYRVLQDDRLMFSARGRARRRPGESYRCVVMGDCGINSPQQKEVAYQIHQTEPEFVLIHGDMVYLNGRISEYRTNYFPIYNSDEASPEVGAPLLRSALFFGGLGQHDHGQPLDVHPDGFAYYLYWSQPLNGPPLRGGDPNTFPLGGTAEQRRQLRHAAGPRYPRMANYSFDYGNTHWVVLDTYNPHADWTDPALRRWLREDLAAATEATWKFVGSYLPPFSSCRTYPQGQKMRVIADIFQEERVDTVFCGFTHGYQRCFPLHFHATPPPQGPVKDPGHQVPGEFQLDRRFDGATHTKPEGVIYMVTGGGGNELHSADQTNAPDTWQPFTHAYVADVHSFTLLEIDGGRFTVRQIDKAGGVIDEFTVTKC